jgi:hypothetical protein
VTAFDRELHFTDPSGLVEYAEKENIERKNRKTPKMNFFYAIYSNDKKIVYLINDKKNGNRKDVTS